MNAPMSPDEVCRYLVASLIISYEMELTVGNLRENNSIQ